jgi:hypothetical protein
MPRGGKRAGVGRVSLWETRYYNWIIKRIHEIEDGEKEWQKLMQRHFKRHCPKHLENLAELQENYRKLRKASLPERRAMIADDCGTPLEETRQIVRHDGFPTLLQFDPRSQFQMNAIYQQVANEAGQKFGREFTIRNIKDCVSARRKRERLFSESE